LQACRTKILSANCNLKWITLNNIQHLKIKLFLLPVTSYNHLNTPYCSSS